MAENPRVLVKLPTGVEGQFLLVSPSDIAAIERHYECDKCLLHLRGHSEGYANLILLSQQGTADRLGITVVDRVVSNDEITARTMQSSAACSGYSQQARVAETVTTPDGIDPIIIERIEFATDMGRVVKMLQPDVDSPLTNGVTVTWGELTRIEHTCPTCGRQTDDITEECWDCMEKHSE